MDKSKRNELMTSALAVMVVGTMGFTTTTAFASPQVDPDLDFCMEHRRPFGDVDSSTPHSKDIVVVIVKRC